MRLKPEQAARVTCRAAVVVLLMGLAFGTASMIVKSFRLMFRATDTMYPETAAAQIALWASRTGRLYPGLQEAPYTPAPYAPLFYLGLARLARLTGTGLWGLLCASRIIAFSCFLLVGVVCYLLPRRLGSLRLWALLGSGFVLSEINFVYWNATARPDLPALLSTLVALYLVCAGETLKMSRVVVAGVCAGLAIMIKQPYVAAPLAIALWLIAQRRFRLLTAFMAAAIVPPVVVVGGLLLRGEPVLEEMSILRHVRWTPAQGFQFVGDQFRGYGLHAVLILLALLGFSELIGKKESRARILGAYFVLAWIVGLTTNAQLGGNTNHLLEGWVASALLAPLGLQRAEEMWSRMHSAAQVAVLIGLLGACYQAGFAWYDTLAAARPEDYTQLAKIFRNHRIFSDIPYLAAQGKDPEMLDPYLTHALEDAGQWSPVPVVENLKSKSYDFVILKLDSGHLTGWRGMKHFGEPILRAIDADYRFLCANTDLALFMPEGRVPELDEQTWAILQGAGCSVRPPQFLFGDLGAGGQEEK